MPFKPEVVKTEADMLMKLLEEVKEISMSDAARKLGVPQATLEAWATFLEEEGVLSVKYQWATPFIVYIPKDKIQEPALPQLFSQKGPVTANEQIKSVAEKTAMVGIKGSDEVQKRPEPREEVHILRKAEDINFLLDKAYEHLKKGDFDNAQELYNQMKGLYYALPKDFLEKKKEIEQGLVKLNKDMGLRIDRFAIKRMDYSYKRINYLLGGAEQDLKKDRLDDAIKKYEEMKSEFEKLPEGFFNEKKELQTNMIHLYEALSIRQRQQFYREFDSKRRNISELIQKLKACIVQGNINYGVSLYEEIRGIYDSLPKGFIEDKIAIQEKIFEIYNELMKKYKEITRSSLEKNSTKIRELIKELRVNLQQNQFGVAEQVYCNIKLLYSQLPVGFIKEKTDLQLEILKAYEELTIKTDDIMTKNAELKMVDISRMLDKAFAYTKANRHDLTGSIYEKAVEEYNQLPQGFSQKKAELRQRILELYRQNLINSDNALLKTTNQATTERYKDLLQLMIQVHQDVEHRNFGVVEVHFNELERLFTELPVGFVEKNPAIAEKITLLREEFDLYKDAMNLLELAKQSGPQVLKDRIIGVQKQSDELRKKCPEDKALFDFIDEKISQLTAVREKSKQVDKTKHEVDLMISTFKASTHSEPKKAWENGRNKDY